MPFRFYPPTQKTTPACCNSLRRASTALDVDECEKDNPPTCSRTSSFAGDSLGACAPKRFSAQGRRWVSILVATGFPVGLHTLSCYIFANDSTNLIC
jgi:hypothetical protein